MIHYIRSFFIIMLCLGLGNGIQYLTELPIPGSVIGMLILFTALSSKLIPASWTRPGCQVLIRNMTLLFVPVSVGLMNHFKLLSADALPILLSTLGSSLIVFIVIGYTTQYMERK